MSGEPPDLTKKIEEVLDTALARAQAKRSANATGADDTDKADCTDDPSKATASRAGEQGDGKEEAPPFDPPHPESPAPAPVVFHVEHPEKIRAHARLYFGLFVLGVGACVLWFGSVRWAVNVPEGTVIMLLSAIPVDFHAKLTQGFQPKLTRPD
jgi:hypothetical protein